LKPRPGIPEDESLKSGRGQPHSRTLRDSVAASEIREAFGVRAYSAAFFHCARELSRLKLRPIKLWKRAPKIAECERLNFSKTAALYAVGREEQPTRWIPAQNLYGKERTTYGFKSCH
jgi:hypothetical protein